MDGRARSAHAEGEQTRSPAQTDYLYSVDAACARPLADAEVARREAAIVTHRATRQPSNNLADWRGRQAWEQSDLELSLHARLAKSEASSLGSGSVRAGEIRDETANHPSSLVPPISPYALTPAAPIIVLSDADQFAAHLRSDLNISGFSKPVEDRIAATCIRKELVDYVLTSTYRHSDIDKWWRRSTVAVCFGVAFIIMGFLGSFAQGAAVAAWGLTGARLIAWVRGS
jgi:hypothetical protein